MNDGRRRNRSPDERAALTSFLAAQRDVVLAIVDGLTEDHLRRSIVPSGWTPLGMIDHLGDSERFWFQEMVAGDAAAPAGSRPSVPDVLSYYRAQAARTDEILAATPLDAPLVGSIPPEVGTDFATVREVVLHLIEETARHAGHLDIARELLDGRTGLRPR